MRSVTWGSLRTEARSYIASIIAVALGIGFLAATVGLMLSMQSSIGNSVASELTGASVVVAPLPDKDGRRHTVPADIAGQVRSVPGVTGVEQLRTGTASLITGGRRTLVTIGTRSEHGRFDRIEGRMTPAAGEVVLSHETARATNLRIGSWVQVAGPSGQQSTVRVIGIADGSGTQTIGVWTTADAVRSLTGTSTLDEVVVRGDGTQAALRSAVASRVGRGVAVRTADEQRTTLVNRFTGGTAVLGTIVGAFGVIALVVAVMVVSNTFSIIVTARTRRTALLRCIGADRRQIARSALGEAGVIGAVGGLLGVAGGAALVAAAAAIANSVRLMPGGVVTRFSPAPVAVGLVLLGAAMALLGSLRPVLAGSKVAPVVALRTDDLPTGRARVTVVRWVAAILLVAAGVLGMTSAVRAHSVPVGLLGVVLTFAGGMLAMPMVVPPVVRGLALPFRASVPTRLAARNAVRNPRRAAATTSALLVGLTLVVGVLVGAASTKQAADRALAKEFPVDISVMEAGSALPEPVVAQLRTTPGVGRSAIVSQGRVSLRAPGGTTEATVIGLDPATREVAHGGSLPVIRAGQVLLPDNVKASLGVHDGEHLSTRAGELVVGATATHNVYVDSSDFAKLGATEVQRALWLDVKNGVKEQDVLGDIKRTVGGAQDVLVVGLIEQRRTFDQVINVLIAVTVGMLGVAVLIALVGVANTLGLSVAERTRELGVLRALGTDRRQIARMVAAEAVLQSLVAIGVGVVLGIAFGAVGAISLLGGLTSVSVVVPWLPIAAAVVVTLLAALAASVIPARSATRIAPVRALAAD